MNQKEQVLEETVLSVSNVLLTAPLNSALKANPKPLLALSYAVERKTLIKPLQFFPMKIPEPYGVHV